MQLVSIRILAAIVLIFSPNMAAHAKDKCAAWSATMGDYEEGRELSAGNCGTANKKPAYIEIRCAANALIFRFEPGSAGHTQVAEPAQTAAFVFQTNTGAYTLLLRYEALDGMYAEYFPADHAFFQSLKSGKWLSIKDKSGQYPESRMSLSNSRSAIDAVIKHCRKK